MTSVLESIDSDAARKKEEVRAMLYLDGASNVPALTAYMLNSALDRQAIAPMWEVKTARLQQEVGDPNAGLTEEERAGQLAAPITGANRGKLIVCYELNSYLRNGYKDYRHISCMQPSRSAANEAGWRDAA